MRYLNNSFWRMIAGLVFVLIFGLILLVSFQFYNDQQTSPDNYLAGSKGEQEW